LINYAQGHLGKSKEIKREGETRGIGNVKRRGPRTLLVPRKKWPRKREEREMAKAVAARERGGDCLFKETLFFESSLERGRHRQL